MERKYEFTGRRRTIKGQRTYQIRALRDFGDVKKGEEGGWIEKEENLSHEGDCWVYDSARVYENARVEGNAKVSDRALVFSSAKIFECYCVWSSNNLQ